MDDPKTIPADPDDQGGEDQVPQAADSSSPGMVDARLQRIMEYLDEALNKKNPLEANLGAANSDLLLIGYRLKNTIDMALADPPEGLSQVEELMPAINTYLRIIKQIERLAQLDRRLMQMRQQIQTVKKEGSSGEREEMKV